MFRRCERLELDTEFALDRNREGVKQVSDPKEEGRRVRAARFGGGFAASTRRTTNDGEDADWGRDVNSRGGS